MKYGFSPNLCDAFENGFPARWSELIADELLSQEEEDDMEEGEAILLDKQALHNHDNENTTNYYNQKRRVSAPKSLSTKRIYDPQDVGTTSGKKRNIMLERKKKTPHSLLFVEMYIHFSTHNPLR